MRRKKKLEKKENELILGYRRSEDSLEEHKRTVKERDLKQELKKRAYQEYMASKNDPKGKHLLDAVLNQDPDVVRYVRLTEGEILDPSKKDMDKSLYEEGEGDGGETETLVYSRTRISEDSKRDDYLDSLYVSADDDEEYEEDFEEEEQYEEVDPLEYARTNISSNTELSAPDELKDDITGRSLYYFDRIKPNRTSISDQIHRARIKEEYLVTGRTSISSNKYIFKKISDNEVPVVKKKNVYRLSLKNNQDLD